MTDTMITVGDCLDTLRGMPDASVDAVVTDPPYGLGREPDPREVLAAWLDGEAYQPGGRGFMGKAWDAFVPSPVVWSECLRVLKPGGHLLAFAGSRTYDWIVLGVRLAGFEVRDQLLWLYGSGFPKSLNVSKAIDRAAGAEREVIGRGRWANVRGGSRSASYGYMGGEAVEDTAPATEAARQWNGWGTALKPAHEPLVWARKPLSAVPGGDTLAECSAIMEALLWSMSPARIVESCSPSSEAERGAGSGSVPWTAAVLPKVSSLGKSGMTGMFNSRGAAETFWSIATSWNSILGASWTLASTSTTKTEIDLITAWRTCASLASLITPESITRAATQAGGIWWSAPNAGPNSSAGGWSCKPTPTHIATERATSEVAARVSRELARIAEQLSAQSEGPTQSSAGESATTPAVAPNHRPIVLARKPLDGTVADNVLEHGTGAINVDGCRVGSDTVSTTPRGAHNESGRTIGGAWSGDIDSTPRAGRWPANVLHDGSPEVLAGFPVTSPSKSNKKGERAGTVTSFGGSDGVRGHDDAGGTAARFFYSAKASRAERERGLTHAKGERRNVHPTVKPVAVMRWLVRLVTPPGGVVLDPFTGSGTTGIAATLEGFRFIGCELSHEYAQIARDRIRHAESNPHEWDPEIDPPAADEPDAVPGQTSLLDLV